MRIELRDNDGPQAFTRVAIEACLDDQLDTIQAAVEGARNRRTIAALAAAYTPPTRTWDQEAWRSAVTSDAASHTSADRMVTWSKPYRLLPVLEATNLAENSDRTALQPTRRAGGPLSAIEQDRMLSAIARLRDANHKVAGWSRATLLGMSRNGIAVSPANQAHILAAFARDTAAASSCRRSATSIRRTGCGMRLVKGQLRHSARDAHGHDPRPLFQNWTQLVKNQ